MEAHSGLSMIELYAMGPESKKKIIHVRKQSSNKLESRVVQNLAYTVLSATGSIVGRLGGSGHFGKGYVPRHNDKEQLINTIPNSLGDVGLKFVIVDDTSENEPQAFRSC